MISILVLRLFRVPDFHIVTGADSSHYYSLLQFLNSLFISQKDRYNVTVYDLGLSENQRTFLLSKFPTVELKRFHFEDYPPFFNIEVNSGEYAWKAIIVEKELNIKKTNLIWLDAGSFVYDGLWFYQIWTWLVGLYSPFSAGTVRDWTHPLAIKRMNFKDELLTRRNISSGVVGISWKSKKARTIINEWMINSLDKSIIAPEGSSRLNHRQDQSVLLLLFWSQYKNIPFYGRHYGVRVHADIDC